MTYKERLLNIVKKQILVENGGTVNEVNYNTDLNEIVNSFSMASLTVRIENEFNVDIPNGYMTSENFNTIESIYEMLLTLEIGK